jgi:hypothetical protein
MRVLLCVLIFFGCLLSSYVLKAQANFNCNIKGRVWISIARSQGIMNGKTFYEADIPFKNQKLFCVGPNDTLCFKTDSVGCFRMFLKPGNYTIEQVQSQCLSKGLVHYGTALICVSKCDTVYQIKLKNHIQGR